jgi:hypothetical protein
MAVCENFTQGEVGSLPGQPAFPPLPFTFLLFGFRQSHSVTQAVLNHGPPGSACPVLGLQICPPPPHLAITSLQIHVQRKKNHSC